MTKQVVEREGVLLEVEYIDPTHADGPDICSVRVLDDHYRPTGPNLALMFDKLFMIVGKGEGEHFLSGVATELT